MKYTLNTYGWSAEFIGISLTKEQSQKIMDIKDELNADHLWEVRLEIEDELGIDFYDGDLIHLNRTLNNDTTHFELLDENGDLVWKFNIEDIEPNDDDAPSYDVPPPTENMDVLFTIDENKGGIFSYEFESDVVPRIDDFGYVPTTVDSPEGFWEIIDGIQYKGQDLEITDYLDNMGKSSEIFIFKSV